MDINYIYKKLLETDPNFKKFVEENSNLSNTELIKRINISLFQKEK